MGFPATGCNTLGNADFILEPWPASRITTCNGFMGRFAPDSLLLQKLKNRVPVDCPVSSRETQNIPHQDAVHCQASPDTDATLLSAGACAVSGWYAVERRLLPARLRPGRSEERRVGKECSW